MLNKSCSQEKDGWEDGFDVISEKSKLQKTVSINDYCFKPKNNPTMYLAPFLLQSFMLSNA